MARGPGREHGARRREIVDAAHRLVAEHGVEALTFRRVATAAGVPTGRVQHYFPGRADLVRAAFDAVQDRAADRVGAALAASGASSARAFVATVLRALLPDDATDVAELRVVAAFEAAALTEPVLAAELRTGHAALVGLLVDRVAQGVAAGELPRDVDPERAVVVLLATAEGLSGQVLHEQLSAGSARRALDDALDRVLGTHPDHHDPHHDRGGEPSGP